MGENPLKTYNLTSTIDRHILSLCERWLRRSGIIVQSKIQVTPTQVELELKLGCDNNISLDMFGCSFSWILLMVWFGLVEGKNP